MDEEEQIVRQRSATGEIIGYCTERYGSNLSNGEYVFSFLNKSLDKEYWLTCKQDNKNEYNYLYVTEEAPAIINPSLTYVWEYNKDKGKMYLKNIGTTGASYLWMNYLTDNQPAYLTVNQETSLYLNNGIKIINQFNQVLYANIDDEELKSLHIYGDNSTKGSKYNIVKAYKVESGMLKKFEGPYEWTSSAQEDQIISTKNRTTTDDIIIKKNETKTINNTYWIY